MPVTEEVDHSTRISGQNVFGQFYCALAYFHLDRLAEAERNALAAVDAVCLPKTMSVQLSSAKIQSRHRIDHFEEPTSPGLDPDIAGVPRAVATLLAGPRCAVFDAM
jgi:hypothetical protein